MAENSESLFVHELRGDNFKRLKHFAVKLNRGVTPVNGKNGAGKSTFLDVVKHLLGDARQHSAEVIRRGEESCELIGELVDDAGVPRFTVERRFRKTEKGELQTVVLKASDGSRLQSPQAVLDSFYNTYTFDPLAFMRLEPKKQLEELKALVGVNAGPLEGKRADLYEKRTDVNRRRTDRGARLKVLPPPPKDLPAEPIDVKALLIEQETKRKEQNQQQAARNALMNLKRDVETATRALESQRAIVDELERRLEAAKAGLLSSAETLQGAMNAFNAQQEIIAQFVEPDFGQVGEKISAAQSTNLWLERRKDREKLEAELKLLDEEEAQLTAGIAQIDEDKRKLIAAAKFPVPGLSFGTDGVLLNEFPLEQASSAEKMRVSTAMGFARNSKVKFMAIHDGSLLDDESMTLLETLCAEHGGQLLIERVGTSDVGVLIEDGEVVPVRAVKGKQQDLLGGAA